MRLPEYIPCKTIVTNNKSTQWFGTAYNMNLYRGCCHGCIYCDSRSDCYRVEHFEQVCAKEDALRVLRDDLRRKPKTGVVGTGSMSDPYNPYDRELLLSRHALELLDAYGFGVAVATKSDLITRDIDLFQSIRSQAPVLCKITVTTCDDALAAKLEPGAPPPSARLAALEKLSGAGLFAGMLLMPVLPFIEDSAQSILAVVRRAAECGARFVYPFFGMTLRDSQRAYYFQQLEAIFPGQGLKEKYQRAFGGSYQCFSPRAKELWGLFTEACDHAGLLYKMQDIVRSYTMGYRDPQLRFF